MSSTTVTKAGWGIDEWCHGTDLGKSTANMKAKIVRSAKVGRRRRILESVEDLLARAAKKPTRIGRSDESPQVPPAGRPRIFHPRRSAGVDEPPAPAD